jgi:putative phosphoribosyl transferase
MRRPKPEEITVWTEQVSIPAGKATLEGELKVPIDARGVVLFTHGSGGSRFSLRNQYVARVIRSAGIGTLLFDLLTEKEAAAEMQTRHLRFVIGLLAGRLVDATHWLEQEANRISDQARPEHLRPGYFGASTGGGAALARPPGSARW